MSERELAAAQNEALYGARHFGQEGFFDFEWLDSIFPPTPCGARLLDIGGGNGVLACRLATSRKAVVTCVEVDEGRARIARQNVFLAALDERVSVLRADMDRLKASTFESYDVVLALDSLQHSGNLPALLAQILDGARLPRVIATIWCCADHHLARRWGFPRGYDFDDIERHVRKIGEAEVAACPVFRRRVARYLDFLVQDESRMAALIGSRAAVERLTLVRDTAAAIKDGSFSQMVLCA